MARIAVHQTPQEIANRLRALYQASEGLECLRIANGLIARLDDGSLTNAHIIGAFAGTPPGIVGRLRAYAAIYQSVLTARSE